jgi:hypothetical protein
MGPPTTWSDCSLSSDPLDRIELMVENGANRIRAFQLPCIRYRAIAGSGCLSGRVKCDRT